MDAPPTRHVEIVAPAGFVPFERSRIEQSIVAAFEARVARAPARPAVKTAAESLSYGELNAWANRIARGLLASMVLSTAASGLEYAYRFIFRTEDLVEKKSDDEGVA